MAPPPHIHHTTSKKRKRDTLTSASGNGNDSDSDYNPRKLNHKPKPKPKSSTSASRDQRFVKTSTSLPLQPPNPYSDVTNGDGEERPDVQLPTPPKISLFSKFGKKAKKSGSQGTNPSSSQESKSGDVSGSTQSASSFTSPQVPPSSTSLFTPALPQSILKSTGKPIPTTSLLATHQTRSATGSLPSAVVPDYAEPSLPSLNSPDFVSDLPGATSPQNPFRTATKGRLQDGQKQPGDSTLDAPPVKPSGIKLRFNFKGKKPAGKSVSFEDTPSVVSPPDTSSQEPTSSYKPPVFGAGNSSSILKTRYQSSPPGPQDSSGSTPSGFQGSSLSSSALSNSQQPHHSFGSFGSAASREPTLEDRILSNLEAEIGSDFEADDIDVPLLEQIVNKNVDSPDYDSGSECEIDADILAEVEAEEADIDNDNELVVVQQEWHPSPELAYNLYVADDQECTKTTEKLYWLQMQAQWAERGGVKNSFLTGLDAEILHLEGVKLRLEQKLSSISNLGGVTNGVANGSANEVDSGQAALQVKQEKLIPSVSRITPTFLYESRNGSLVERANERGRKKTNSRLLVLAVGRQW